MKHKANAKTRGRNILTASRASITGQSTIWKSATRNRGRFEARITDPIRQWKLSPMDLPSRTKWFEYSRARDLMLKATDTKWAPWRILHSDDKKRARLNCIHHLLKIIPYKKLPREQIKLPKR